MKLKKLLKVMRTKFKIYWKDNTTGDPIFMTNDNNSDLFNSEKEFFISGEDGVKAWSSHWRLKALDCRVLGIEMHGDGLSYIEIENYNLEDMVIPITEEVNCTNMPSRPIKFTITDTIKLNKVLDIMGVLFPSESNYIGIPKFRIDTDNIKSDKLVSMVGTVNINNLDIIRDIKDDGVEYRLVIAKDMLEIQLINPESILISGITVSDDLVMFYLTIYDDNLPNIKHI